MTARGDSRQIDRPRCGYWAVRLTAGAPEVGASIQWEQTTFEPGEHMNLMERSPILTARLDGRIVTVEEVWTRRGREISPEEYFWLIEDRKWARRYAPHLPEANPTKAADLRAIPAIMPPRR